MKSYYLSQFNVKDSYITAGQFIVNKSYIIYKSVQCQG